MRVTFAEIKDVVRTNEKQRFAMIRRDDIGEEGLEDDDQDPSHFLIRATQGHSIKIEASNLLTPLTLETAPVLAVHGSYRAAWPLILASGGLKKMGRTHIHFAPAAAVVAASTSASASTILSPPPPPSSPLNAQSDTISQEAEAAEEAEAEAEVEDQAKVISGMRTTSDLHIYVNIHRSMKDGGIEWWKSENGVLLTEGSKAAGVLGVEWFEEVRLVDVGGGEGKILWRDGKEVEKMDQADLKGGARKGLLNVGKDKSKKGRGKGKGKGRPGINLGRKGGEIDDDIVAAGGDGDGDDAG